MAFDDYNWQIHPLMACLMGNVTGVMKIFERCGWQAEDVSRSYLYLLTAHQSVSKKE